MLRWGILGTGFISNTVIEAIAQSDGSQAVVVAGRRAEAVQAMRQTHNLEVGVVGFDQVLADPDIDVVYIGTPNHEHHPLAIAAAQAGKAVLSEKSLTTTMESAHALVAAARNHDTFFVEGLMYLAHPLYRRVIELLSDGALGTVTSVSGRYGADIAHLVNPAGRGTIYNLGCYPVSLLHLVVQTVFGEEAFARRAVTAVGNTSAADGTVVDAALTARFECGVLATLQSSDRYGNTSEFSVATDAGVLRFETNPWLPVAGANILTWQPHDSPVERIIVDDPHDAFYHQIKMVEACLASSATEAARPSPRLVDSIEIMSLLTEWEALCLAS